MCIADQLTEFLRVLTERYFQKLKCDRMKE